MIDPILENIAAYLKTNTGTWLKDAYHNVSREPVDDKIYPFAWTDGLTDGRPLFADFDTNYLYLRMNGEMSASPGTVRTSCTKTNINTYPIRCVFHSREDKGGNYTDRRGVVIEQLMGAYTYAIPSGSNIERVRIQLTGRTSDKFEVFEDETSGVELTQISRQDNIGAVEFDVIVTYTPSATCVEDDLFCALPSTISQIAPCPDAPTDTITLNFGAGETEGYIKAAEVALSVDSLADQDNIASVSYFDEDDNSMVLPASLGRGKWLRVVITQTNAAATSSVTLTRTMEDGSATVSSPSPILARWNTSAQGVTIDRDYSADYPYVVKCTGTNSSNDNGETVLQTLSPPFTLGWTVRGGGQWYTGFSENPYAMPANNVHTSMDYSIIFNSNNNRLQVAENGGVPFQISNYLSTHTLDELIEIENTGSAVNYKVNNVTIYTSLNLPGGGDCTGVFAPVHVGVRLEDLTIT